VNGPLLYLIARQDRDGFPGLRAALRFFGGPKADMQSHQTVFYNFLSLLWPPDDALPWLKTAAATGLSLEAFLGNRKADWAPLLGEITRFSTRRRDLAEYVSSWVKGHFITESTMADAMRSRGLPRSKRRKAA
jgi:hypothetical protein